MLAYEIMEEWQIDHFYAWLLSHAPAGQFAHWQGEMLAVLSSDPALLNDHSWSEIASMAGL